MNAGSNTGRSPTFGDHAHSPVPMKYPCPLIRPVNLTICRKKKGRSIHHALVPGLVETETGNN